MERKAASGMDAKLGLALVLALSVFALPSADIRAQAPSQPNLKSTATVDLSVEQRHTFKEMVKDLKIPPVNGDAPSAIGERVPERIVTQPVPVEVSQRVPHIRLHAFYVKDRRIVVVDPKERKIAAVID